MTWFAEIRRLWVAPPAIRETPSLAQARALHTRPRGLLSRLWNRGLPDHVRIEHRVLWPLFLLPIALLNQFLAPHPVWIVLIVTLMGVYGVGFLWVRSQATEVTLGRRRLGSVLVAGDTLREDFELRNTSPAPVLWAEFLDHSTLRDYNAGRVVGCNANSTYRWNSTVECRRRGIYRLGPHDVRLGDPFSLFQLTIHDAQTEVIVIYPHVAHLPVLALPRSDTSGVARRRRPLMGPLPSASVRDYRPTDSLRYVHWPLTAHRGELMVKELEIEPSGGVWIVLDLNASAHSTVGDVSTLEFGVVVAASLAAELLAGGERRTVGLLTVSDHEPYAPGAASEDADLPGGVLNDDVLALKREGTSLHERAVMAPPQPGQAQLWRILAALAPVQATTLTLAELLRTNHAVLGRREAIVVITAQRTPTPGADDWSAELLHLDSAGLASSVVLIAPPHEGEEAGEVSDALRGVLARHDIPMQTLEAGVRLPPALVFRRTRKVVRTTPTGGVVTYEVEEDVG